jgi:hypothetical protein
MSLQGWKRKVTFDELVKEMVEADVEGVRSLHSLRVSSLTDRHTLVPGQAQRPRLSFLRAFVSLYFGLLSSVMYLPSTLDPAAGSVDPFCIPFSARCRFVALFLLQNIATSLSLLFTSPLLS